LLEVLFQGAGRDSPWERLAPKNPLFGCSPAGKGIDCTQEFPVAERYSGMARPGLAGRSWLMGVGGWGRTGLVTGLAWACALSPAWPLSRRLPPETSSLQIRGAEVGKALLVEYYNELPQPRAGENPQGWAARMQTGLAKFQKNVQARYTEATLQRLLDCPTVEARRAAVLALGLQGSFQSNAVLASMLHDEDRLVQQLAADALWSLWFRADTETHSQELRRLTRQSDPRKAIAGLDALIKRAPRFAEAYNQRAILYFRLEEYQHSIADCEIAIKFNPYHFGAQAGMAQCYMKLKKPRAALKAFRLAFELNPNLDGVEETIHFLEDALGEEGKKDDKK
jgi:tetratricopeptide (TPR) repeat protein